MLLLIRVSLDIEPSVWVVNRISNIRLYKDQSTVVVSEALLQCKNYNGGGIRTICEGQARLKTTKPIVMAREFRNAGNHVDAYE